MSPGEFIPLFEKNGMIPRLDQYVWEQTCISLMEWKKKGYSLVPVSVNVSRADVYQLDLVNVLMNLTNKYMIDPSYLHLEITESAYARNPGEIISTMNQLRKEGFIIEMDDFGSGYSSLNMLSQMELDILKLDMKFIQNEIEKPANESILDDIIKMAHRIRLHVVAEGVETRKQINRLKAIGCDYVQGYYFAKPMPAIEFEELLQNGSVQPALLSSMEFRRPLDMRTLLVVDEEEEYRKRICQTFEGEYLVLEASDVEGALDCINSKEHDGVSAMILSMTLPGDGAADIMKVMRQNPQFWHIPILAAIPNGSMMKKFPLAMETDDFLCKCHPLSDLRRRIERLIDIMVLHERETMLQDEANRDFMTGLLNRRGLQKAVASLRKEELPMAVCLFDLDDLKKVNDTCGHETGDHIIQYFADILNKVTRSEDIKCRYGGDEFILIMKSLKDKDIVMKKTEDICRTFQSCPVSEDFHASCSCGVVLSEEDVKSSGSLIEWADQALYRAKKEKKGNCFLWKGGSE